MDRISEMDDLLEGFFSIPYLGAGLKTAKAARNIMQYYMHLFGKNKELFKQYDEMSDEELNAALPAALASDLNDMKDEEQGRAVIIVDNYVKVRAGDWFRQLINNTKTILWIVISKNPLQYNQNDIEYVNVEKLTRQEMEDYLETQCGISTFDTRKKIEDISGGSMFIIQRILDVLRENRSVEETEWDTMMDHGISNIMSNLFNALPYEKREVLIQLSFARYFDEDLFKQLFPGRLFGMYRRWFRGTMFSYRKEKGYSVQNGMKEAVISYVNNLDTQIILECKKNLFEATASKLQGILSREHTRAMENIGDELNSLIYYGTGFRHQPFYVRAIINLRPVFFYSQGAGLYLEELKEIAKKNLASKDKGLMNSGLMTTVLLELAATELQMGQYEEAYESVEKGIGFAKESGDSVCLQQMVGIKMRLIHIYPIETEDKNDSVVNAISLAEEYLRLLDENRDNITYREYIQNKISVCLFKADEYRILQDFDSAKGCLEEPLAICSDSDSMGVLKLYRLYATALEHMGVIEETLRNYEVAKDYYLRSIGQYRLAELLEPYWDPDFYLNWGLVYKRLGEAEFHLEGQIVSSFDQIDKALIKYKMVADQMPEMIDTYCKIGFACTNSMEKLLNLPENLFDSHLRESFENYAEICQKAVEDAFDSMGSKEKGNRQIWNISCSYHRSEGTFLWRSGKNEEAKESFEKAVEAGQSAVKYYPEHPYSYLGLARACLAYKKYLDAIGESDRAGEYSRKGLEAIVVSRRYTSDENSFEDVYRQLK